MNLETKIEAYEDLTEDKSSDRYEYIFPSYEFSKIFSSNYSGNYEIKSKGNYKNYDTNVFEKVLINDLKFTSYPKISRQDLLINLIYYLKISLLRVIIRQRIKTNLVQKITVLFL